MKKLEKLLSAKWLLFVVGMLVAAAAVGQEMYLADGQMNLNIVMLGVAVATVCGAFCEAIRMVIYKTAYNLANVATWFAAGVVAGVLASAIW